MITTADFLMASPLILFVGSQQERLQIMIIWQQEVVTAVTTKSNQNNHPFYVFVSLNGYLDECFLNEDYRYYVVW